MLSKLPLWLKSMQIPLVKSKQSITSVEVKFDSQLALEQPVTQTTDKWLEIRVNWLMLFQMSCCVEMLWTFSTYIWLHFFMSKQVLLELPLDNKFLLTDVTCEPCTFIVWLQHMSLQLESRFKPASTVFTWVQLWISVNRKMNFQILFSHKQYSTVRTVIWSYVAVHITFMLLQAGGVTKRFVTHWTLVWFLSCVDSHVSV